MVELKEPIPAGGNRQSSAFTSTLTRHSKTYPAIDPTQSSLSAKGSVVLITGGGQGIGLSIALGFAKAGASHIILLGRNITTLNSGKAQIATLYPVSQIYLFAIDITDESAISSLFTKIHAEVGLINILVSNASYLPTLGPIASANISDWFRSFDVMVRGAMIVSQAFLKHKAAENAVLINISSGAVQMGPIPAFSTYASSKLAAVKAFEYLAAENPDVRVVSVHPGTIKSDMSAKTSETYGIEFTFDEFELPGCFCVWLAGPDAEFLDGRYVWALWDVEELVARKDKIVEGNLLKFGLVQ